MSTSLQPFFLAVGQPLIILILVFIFLRSRFKFKSSKNIFLAVVLGMASVVFIFLFDLLAGSLGYDMLKNLKRTGFYSFVIVGFGAELGKFVFLRYYFLKKDSFKGPLDGVIYAVMLSLGFTLIALPLFALGVFSKPVSMQFLYTYTFANLAFAAVLGFFTGMGKFRRNRLVDSLTALGAASFFHGFYYFVNLTTDTTIFVLYSAGLSFIALLLVVKSFNVRENDAPAKY